MADPDNAGGGAPSDNTTILRRMLERNVHSARLGPMWDPIAVRLCLDAGLGAAFPLRFGGKIGPTSARVGSRADHQPCAGAWPRIVRKIGIEPTDAGWWW